MRAFFVILCSPRSSQHEHVRRQSLWDSERGQLREALARLVGDVRRLLVTQQRRPVSIFAMAANFSVGSIASVSPRGLVRFSSANFASLELQLLDFAVGQHPASVHRGIADARVPLDRQLGIVLCRFPDCQLIVRAVTLTIHPPTASSVMLILPF